MNVVELEGVEKSRRGAGMETTITFRLDSLQVAEGARLALVGPSGCGKSTLLNLISGVSRADAGSILVAGERVDRLRGGEIDRFRGRSIGYVFQDFNLAAALTAMENVLLGLRFGRSVPRSRWRERAAASLERVGMTHRAGHRPNRLSVGERQRVAIARALVNRPQLILADEPTGSLDPVTGETVFELLLEACSEDSRTLLVVTHDASIAQRVDDRFDCSDLMHESGGVS